MNALEDLRIPDVVGEISGYRAWRVEWCGRVPRLFSINAHTHSVDLDDAMWPAARWFEAKCNKCTPDEIPDEHCSCGLYAAKTIEQLVGLHYGAYGDELDDKVIGEVGFAGKVIEGSQGWRAEKGRIVHLWVPISKWEWVGPLEAAYRVPVSLADWRQIER